MRALNLVMAALFLLGLIGALLPQTSQSLSHPGATIAWGVGLLLAHVSALAVSFRRTRRLVQWAMIHNVLIAILGAASSLVCLAFGSYVLAALGLGLSAIYYVNLIHVGRVMRELNAQAQAAL